MIQSRSVSIFALVAFIFMDSLHAEAACTGRDSEIIQFAQQAVKEFDAAVGKYSHLKAVMAGTLTVGAGAALVSLRAGQVAASEKQYLVNVMVKNFEQSVRIQGYVLKNIDEAIASKAKFLTDPREAQRAYGLQIARTMRDHFKVRGKQVAYSEIVDLYVESQNQALRSVKAGTVSKLKEIAEQGKLIARLRNLRRGAKLFSIANIGVFLASVAQELFTSAGEGSYSPKQERNKFALESPIYALAVANSLGNEELCGIFATLPAVRNRLNAFSIDLNRATADAPATQKELEAEIAEMQSPEHKEKMHEQLISAPADNTGSIKQR